MKKYLILLTYFCFACNTPSNKEQKSITPQSNANSVNASKTEILKILHLQSDAWNDGNLEAFMNGYWKSDSLTFVGSKGLTYGWEETLSNYKISYPDKDIMGQLKFDVLSLNELAPDAFHMIGKYTLTREEDQPSGFFTLIWRLKNNNWVITADQSN